MGKAIMNSGIGHAIKGGARMANSLYGCTMGKENMGYDEEILYPKNDKMCLVTPSGEELEVTLLEDVKEGQATTIVLLPSGKRRGADVAYLRECDRYSDEYEDANGESEN